MRKKKTNKNVYNQLEHSQIKLHTHTIDLCKGEVCSIHNKTDHNLRSYPQFYRFDRGIMERICDHGVGHPDPDDYLIRKGIDDGTHGCDGCCYRFATQEEYDAARSKDG